MKFTVEVWINEKGQHLFSAEFHACGMIGISTHYTNPLAAMDEARKNWCSMDSWHKAQRALKLIAAKSKG